MKQKFLWLMLSLVTWAQAAALDAPARPLPELKPEQYEAKAAHLAADLLSRYHYKAMPLDKTMSDKIFDQYLKSLDPEKSFFTQEDIARISKDRTRFGELILNEDLSIPFVIFNLYQRRVTDRLTYARSLLQQEFDFDVNESFQVQREKQTWPASDSEANDLWRKRVKNDWLNLKLAGKDDKGIVDVLYKRYDSFLKRVSKVNSADAFQAFMNAYTMAIEPHTNYMGIRESAEFDIAMRLSLIGIGAVLAQPDDYTTIRELVSGGPASLSGQLKVGDRIVGVGQGRDGAITDIMGWRQDEAVALIRGPADTIVRLEIIPAEAGLDGKHKLVSLVRKPINLKEQAAKSSIQSVKDGKSTHRIGVISLPSFYEDFAARNSGNKEFKSASHDVAKILGNLKKAKVDGVLLDLRNNGGGSLSEAVALTGLFIGAGPVVQQRNAEGKVWVERATDAKPVWNGPLGVLINRNSASASEIVAAAIQDYGRGVIVGEPSWGKGTVQAVVDLDKIVKSNKPQLGGLRMTIAQFFRINGGTTQLRGVTPDISLPGFFEEDEMGEASFGNALPWTQIRQADYTPLDKVRAMLAQLSVRHDARTNRSREFKYLEEDIAEYKLQRKKNEISLNQTERRKEREVREARIATRKEDKTASGIQAPLEADALTEAADGLEPEERSLAQDLAYEKSEKNTKDVLLIEAAHILSDAVGLSGNGGKLASNGGAHSRLQEN